MVRMIFVHRLSYLYLVVWILAFLACSLQQPQNEPTKSPTENISAEADENGTTYTPGVGFEEDFPPLNFYLKDIRTILLERVNHNSSSRANVSLVLDLDEVINELEEVTDDNGTQNISGLNYETLWDNGSLTLTLVEVEKRVQNISGTSNHIDTGFSIVDGEENLPRNSNVIREDLSHFLRRHHSQRLKRAVFGTDQRIRLTNDLVRKQVNSAVVRIATGSSGCTGTLISSYHVLTAAHCVHDGIDYRMDIRYLKVGIVRHQGKLRWIRAQYVKVPRGWTIAGDYRYDYAVIKLRRPHGLLSLGMYGLDPEVSVSLRQICFASFPADKPKNELWRSCCRAHLVEHYILNRCDSNYGSSGAGIYSVEKKTSHQSDVRILGVFSGLGHQVLFRGKRRRMNIGIKITPLILAQIRYWMKTSHGGYSNASVLRRDEPQVGDRQANLSSHRKQQPSLP